MKKQRIQDAADKYYLGHFVAVGFIFWLAMSEVDLNKITERVTAAIALGSLVHSSLLRPVRTRYEEPQPPKENEHIDISG